MKHLCEMHSQRLKMSIRCALCILMLGGLLTPARTQTSSKTLSQVVVELFTSEGCSSCPPADALLQTLDRAQPISGVQLIVLSEHVDYWDDLGWKDTYSSHAITERQENYAHRLGVAGPYTPQMVVDGTFEFVGNNKAQAAKAFGKARALSKIPVQISSVTSDNGNVRAHIETGPLPSKAEVIVALAFEHAQSQVLHGENGGHRLEHVAVLRKLVSAGKAEKGSTFSQDVNLPNEDGNQVYRLIAFVQKPNQGAILGAAIQRVTK
jgi:hypothetical protein